MYRPPTPATTSSTVPVLNGEDPNTALTHAVSENLDVTFIELLLNKADPNIKDRFDQTALFYAINNANLDVVRLLLTRGSNPNITDRYGRNALLYAIFCLQKKSHDEIYYAIIELLLEHAANPNMKDVLGLTALMYAEYNQKVVELLLTHGADPNIKDSKGETALHHAIDNSTVLRLLLEHGANPNIKDGYGDTVLTRAIDNSTNFDVLQLLLDHGADPNIQDAKGRTSLLVALSKNVGIIELLLKHGADPNIQDNVGNAALINTVLTARKYKDVIINMLLEYLANPNIQYRYLDETHRLSFLYAYLIIKRYDLCDLVLDIANTKSKQELIKSLRLLQGITYKDIPKDAVTYYNAQLDTITLKLTIFNMNLQPGVLQKFVKTNQSMVRAVHSADYKPSAKFYNRYSNPRNVSDNTITKYKSQFEKEAFKKKLDNPVLRNIALDKWHKDTTRYTMHLYETERKQTIRSFFSLNLVLASTLIPNMGYAMQLDQTTVKTISDALRIVNEAPRTPKNIKVFRTVLLNEGAPGFSIPLEIGDSIPHMISFATTLVDVFAISWKQGGDCCVFEIDLPKGTAAYFWGPTPFNVDEARDRMSKSVFDKKANCYEVLVSPHVLKVYDIYKKAYSADDINQVDAYVGRRKIPLNRNMKEITIYRCKLLPIKVNLLQRSNILYAPDFLTKQGVKQITELVAAEPSIQLNKATTRRSMRPQKQDDMDSKLKELEQTFVTIFVEANPFGFQDIAEQNRIVGIALLPIDGNNLWVGKENDGEYKGKYNLFGGKTSDKIQNSSNKSTASQIATVLFQEIYEEMGIVLDATQLINSMIDIDLLQTSERDKYSMLIGFNITNFNTVYWKSIMASRVMAEHKYYEMTDVMTINYTRKRNENVLDMFLSKYVISALDIVRESYKRRTNYTACDVATLKTVRIDSKGVVRIVSPT
jgi:ankyrin repeat protein